MASLRLRSRSNNSLIVEPNLEYVNELSSIFCIDVGFRIKNAYVCLIVSLANFPILISSIMHSHAKFGHLTPQKSRTVSLTTWQQPQRDWRHSSSES
jgi:hypothetical protein